MVCEERYHGTMKNLQMILDGVGIYYEPVPFTSCMIWTRTGSRSTGYGWMKIGRRGMLAHRAMWEAHNGPVPEGKIVMHICDTPGCVNIDHLRLGTQRDNMIDRAQKGRGNSAGEHNGSAKITEAIVREIRASRAPGTVLAHQYGITGGAVSMIRNRTRWGHVS